MHPGTVQCTFTAWHSETEGANGSEPERRATWLFCEVRALTDVTGEKLRLWREAKGWDVPRMARELRKVARDSGEDVAAHHGLVKMIPQWERGGRVPRERYRLLYLKVFADTLGDLSQGMALGTDLALRLAEVRSRAARLPGSDEINALEAAALAKPGETMTPAEIRALAAEAIAHLREVADKLAELSALLGDDESGEDKP
jgi:transcriptional regulator with XRE-family HTH domain